MDNRKKTILILTVLTILLLGIASWQGAFNPKTYEKDSLSFGTQGIGQDLVNLFFVLPLLLISCYAYLKNSLTGRYVFTGSVFYVLYSYVIYAFGVNFNSMFLIYCFLLGSSLYLFIFLMTEFAGIDVENRAAGNVSIKIMSYFMILIAVMFYFLWLSDTLPAVLSSTVPKSVIDANLLVNPVHVLDMGIVLPGLILSAVLLLKNNRLGLILGPVLLMFTVILTVALAGMVVMLNARNVSEDISLMYVFVTLSVISLAVLILFFKNLRRN